MVVVVKVALAAVSLMVVLGSLSLGASGSDACATVMFVEDVGRVCVRDDGLLDVLSDEDKVLGTVHGLDAPPAADDGGEGEEAGADPAGHTGGAGDAPPRPPACVPLGTPYSMRVIYARAGNVADRSATLRAEIREMVNLAAGYVAYSAAPLGVGVNLRVQCDAAGAVSVANEFLPHPVATRTFGTIVQDLQARGYTDSRVKYWVWHDDGASAGCGGGVGSLYSDDRPGAENWNNGNAGPLFAVTLNCRNLLGGEVMSHENGHNMGAVQHSAPNTSGAFHCIDGHDIMCYDDGGPRSNLYTTGVCPTFWYDCGNNDYFHPNPPPSNYLSTHWNLGGANNRFIARNACALLGWDNLVVGTPPGAGGVGVFGVNLQRFPVPSSCWGHPFVLTSQNGFFNDFDVCMETETTRLQCYENTGDEAGTIPAGTTRAAVFYYMGAAGEWILYAD